MKYGSAAALVVALLGLLGLLGSAAAPAAEKIAMRAACATCHTPTAKMVGPAYRDIAIKCKGQPKAVAMLS